MSKITESTHRLPPSSLVKISISLEGIKFFGYLTMMFKNNGVFNSAGLSKIWIANYCYNWLFLTVRIVLKIAEIFLNVSVLGLQKERPSWKLLCFYHCRPSCASICITCAILHQSSSLKSLCLFCFAFHFPVLLIWHYKGREIIPHNFRLGN